MNILRSLQATKTDPAKRMGPLANSFPFQTAVLAGLVAVLCYLAARLGGALTLHPQTLCPLWPACALLVSVLLLVPRKIWPVLIPAGFAAFVVYDLQTGLALGSILWLILADTIEVLIAALCVSYCFDGVPRLNSVKALAKYSFFAVILAPLAGAFVGALALDGDYWTSWRIGFFSEALAFLTLTPAILCWVGGARAWSQRSRAEHLEAAALTIGLVLLGYFTFVASGKDTPPALLYSLIPFLLWSGLRFGTMGASTSVIVVAFLSIWGAVHGRGPFTGPAPLNNVLSLQLFLLFAATPFMVLAALVEEHRRAEEALRKSEERFRLAAQAGKMFAYEWDAATDAMVRSAESAKILGVDEAAQLTGQQVLAKVHPDDREALTAALAELTPENPHLETSYRVVRPDGTVIWLQRNSRAHFDDQGRMLRIVGMVGDITERKLAEEALAAMRRSLIEAQEQERTRIARDLHDDTNQRLALLAVAIDQLKRDMPNATVEVLGLVDKLRKETSEISNDIQALSHELHSPRLEYLGLAAAMKGFCKEFGHHQNVEIDFRSHDLPNPVPPDVSLCLFRVLQEALHNSAKHSGTRRFEVQLWGTSGEIHFTVSDFGSGFDLEAALKSRGLGLTSMRERLQLVKGKFSIESQPQRGTTIHARVPISSGDDSVRATG